mmetsp:Transcript_9260/g.23404  ORF Transcript_9260/g.23404 Transcript_9260/m.23404 type:complete len:211 (-) Transcript_9260:1070-1702(-)
MPKWRNTSLRLLCGVLTSSPSSSSAIFFSLRLSVPRRWSTTSIPPAPPNSVTNVATLQTESCHRNRPAISGIWREPSLLENSSQLRASLSISVSMTTPCAAMMVVQKPGPFASLLSVSRIWQRFSSGQSASGTHSSSSSTTMPPMSLTMETQAGSSWRSSCCSMSAAAMGLTMWMSSAGTQVLSNCSRKPSQRAASWLAIDANTPGVSRA